LRVSFKTWFVVGSALTFAACDGSRTLAFDDLAPEIKAASCRVSVMCGDSPDQATCVASLQIRESLFETLQVDIANGIVKYDGRAARACVDNYASVNSCTFTELLAFNKLLDATCGKVFTGTLPPGSNCFFNEECMSHGSCDRSQCATTGGCCAGTCVAPPVSLPAGGDCTTADTECVDGTRCTTNPAGSPSLICQAEIGAGAACNSSADTCALPYTCVPPDPVNTTGGTCTAPPATGEACGASSLGAICNDLRDACDDSTLVCVRRPPVGSSCDVTSNVGCAGNAYCDGTICVAQGGLGAACDPGFPSPCLGNLECDATLHCALPPTGPSCR
jgi:hypothetical protein